MFTSAWPTPPIRMLRWDRTSIDHTLARTHTYTHYTPHIMALMLSVCNEEWKQPKYTSTWTKRSGLTRVYVPVHLMTSSCCSFSEEQWPGVCDEDPCLGFLKDSNAYGEKADVWKVKVMIWWRKKNKIMERYLPWEPYSPLQYPRVHCPFHCQKSNLCQNIPAGKSQPTWIIINAFIKYSM